MEEINLKNLTPDVRKLSDMKAVIYDKEWLKIASDADLYFMYRKVEQKEGLNHNITIIPARMLGAELVKTAGHVHVGPQQEIYTVLEGESIFLMQKTNGEVVEDVYAVHAKKGESAIIPPLYGHVTINPCSEDLKTSDWSSETTRSDYSLFQKLRGACYYYTREGWIKNENYKSVPELRLEEPLRSVPKDLSFLKN